ncbi:MAG: hypothetical protein UX49_C0009G0032 [Candidatus Wolfebacteria bacterium GW2011_GWC2_46_275]|uniref:Uncharacterized protein n=2 Tax=Candidatus Wolfeibacteriota TaxID=1752735 RepID=A0A0G1U6C9_9BACT|nr:MAG: hypothetical protein UX70_C0001G0750 [Candidatus Wolfebacteria bacterium GW2011_GWB1_47_1]KKU36787.1 MAG: hypothetical protein UX49_C0009G0032 [Candidatus Wolfebacteria bacterium GW2011_GWC2_46_275]KKU42327.1 MAG: hypothetical protein UX58_C0002G0041 [Candidatus Wolfebacteria bacterium GW2011_GWB2_46_69]KKU53667.1 MAG: hypothetical protein UX76_C0011G0012 [Candidatus Wolfebacteria bacterium GW2011_GWC1_47_103]KKU58912.1 MAG: hypothetical protein UX83_C0010G0034 [Candidatus Wolfebacteria
MKIEWNKVTWYSKVAAVILGVGILLLGMYIGVMYQRGLDAIELVGQLELDQPAIAQKKTVSVYGFEQIGNIKNMATGDVEEDIWVLIYERPGESALTKGLIFTTNSRCVIRGNEGFCNTAEIEQGNRVMVMGALTGGGVVIVERLEVR